MKPPELIKLLQEAPQDLDIYVYVDDGYLSDVSEVKSIKTRITTRGNIDECEDITGMPGLLIW